MRVSIHKPTGALIEAQSNDKASLAPLLANAIAAGHTAAEVETKVVSDEAFAALLATAGPVYSYRELRAAAYTRRLSDGKPTFAEAVGDTIDALQKKVRTLEVALASALAQLQAPDPAWTAPSTTEPDFDGKAAEIDAIKQEFGKEGS